MTGSRIKQIEKPLHQLTAVQLLEQLNLAISRQFFGAGTFGRLSQICREIKRREWETGTFIDRYRINLRYRYKLLGNHLTIAEDRQVEDFALLIPAALSQISSFQNN
ncbi:hypothetical protein [Persicobacter diffluens]|uniref:Uncharacterized protein n=1 Tax=Persicobacter diffluens TaxID=981 RepID=A0AAN4W232_9BACT|nr:hypothetical protein PEDI_30620 [Persicobacter diffluens]